MKHKGPAVWLQQWGQHQSVLFLPISLRGEVVVWPIMTFMKAPLRRTYEDLWWCWPCRPHKCCRCGAFHCRCGIQFWALKEKWVWSGAILLFCFRPGTSRERRTGLSVSPEQTVWDGGHAVLLWNFEEGDWVPFRKPFGNVYGKTCVGHWNLLKEEYSTSAMTSPRERGTGLCDQKCHGKSVHCSQPNTYLFFWSCDSPTGS